MNIFFKSNIASFFLLIFVVACSTNSATHKQDIYQKWAVEKIVYSDGSTKILTDGNFVQINRHEIIEIIKGHGSRRYQMNRKENKLTISTTNSTFEWIIMEQGENTLRIKTPIGLYVLVR